MGCSAIKALSPYPKSSVHLPTKMSSKGLTVPHKDPTSIPREGQAPARLAKAVGAAAPKPAQQGKGRRRGQGHRGRGLSDELHLLLLRLLLIIVFKNDNSNNDDN